MLSALVLACAAESVAPQPGLSDEATKVLRKHGGSLNPEAGQWQYTPTSDCGWGLDQWDKSASVAVILAGSMADNECRICGPKHKGQWVNPGAPPKLAGCTDDQWAEIERLYHETECRLGRHGEAGQRLRCL